MPLLRTGLALLCAWAAVPALVAQAVAPSSAAIDSIFAQYNHTNAPGCALAVFRNEQTVYTRGYGMADLNQGIAISPATVFYVASTSKQFTALSVALLAEQGKINLDDPVRKWIPELPAYTGPITIRHLLHHTSGIRDYLGLWGLSGRSSADEIPAEEALDLIVRQRQADFAPGAKWSYSNSGYFLLSQIVKRASERSLREFAEANVFGPLGMASTHWHDDNQMIVPRRAEGYQPNGKGGFEIVRTSFALVGDGGLLTTVEDLARYDANFYHNRLGERGQGLIDQVTTPGTLANGEPLTYAFGLFIDTHRGLKVIQHGGSFIGFRAELVRFPSEKLSVAVLCNDYTANPEQLAYRVADLYLAGRVAPADSGAKPASVTVSGPALDRLVGRYELMPGMVAVIGRNADGLTFGLGPGPQSNLSVISDTVFVSDRFPGTLTFVRTPDGGPAIVASVFGKDPGLRLPEPPVLTAVDRAALAGRYLSDELDTWAVIEAVGDSLRARVRYAPWLTLKPLRKDEFLVVGAGASIVFQRDGAGVVTGYRLNAARSRNIGFRRLVAPPAGRSDR